MTAKHSLRGGGTEYVYNVGGMKVHSVVPPAGFKPARASAAKLKEYGFPPRPASGRALRTWLAAVSKAHPAKVPDRLIFTHPARPKTGQLPSVTVYDNPIWAGNMATSETYTNVYGAWLEPSITEAECPADYQMESTWAGLGGANTGTLVQAGTQYGEGQLSSGLANHQAWYELISGSTNDFVHLPVTATVGGEMYVNIYRASSKGYNIYVENEYTGSYWGVNFVTFSPFDGSTAEFIAEDPYGGVENGVYLIRFGTFEVEDAEASVNDSTFSGLASWPHDDDVMISPTIGDTMAYAGSAFNSGDSWYDYHEHCE
ncbi:MAG TPA: G1 family glutamic endopeptidase [Streptosporangiaceae bacterium]|nr:G1 family glutamic endopeptidase [Streptosporangiaceae bacterium]